MRAYVVTAGKVRQYAGTSALARATREALVKETGLKKKDITIEDAEIPYGKAELLAWLNELVRELQA